MAAFERHVNELPVKTASAVNPGGVLTLDTGDTQRQVVPVASLNILPIGVALATGASPGDAVTLEGEHSIVKVVAGASLGQGAVIGVGSTNGSLAPVAGASGSVKCAVGDSLSAAAAGETFSLYVRPRVLSGTP
jgi:hypothetical protein